MSVKGHRSQGYVRCTCSMVGFSESWLGPGVKLVHRRHDGLEFEIGLESC